MSILITLSITLTATYYCFVVMFLLTECYETKRDFYISLIPFQLLAVGIIRSIKRLN